MRDLEGDCFASLTCEDSWPVDSSVKNTIPLFLRVYKIYLLMWISGMYCLEKVEIACVNNRLLDRAEMGEPQVAEGELQAVFRITEMSLFPLHRTCLCPGWRPKHDRKHCKQLIVWALRS